MPRAAPINSWKAILEEVGQRPSTKEWEKYGIPEGTPWKTAAAIRAYQAIVEDGAVHLLPKFMEFMEPSTKKVEVHVSDWKVQFEQLGVPMDLLADRLQDALSDVIDGEFKLEPGTPTSVDPPVTESQNPPRRLELDSGGRPSFGLGVKESDPGQTTREDAVGPDRETETTR
jgi:hypothetical protein